MKSSDRFKEWLSEDINYLFSENVPTEEIFETINKGQLVSYWNHLMRLSRSQNVISHIRANLQVERHRKEISRNLNITSTIIDSSSITDELEAEERKKEFAKCERRLKKIHLGNATLQQEIRCSQKISVEMYNSIEDGKARLRDSIRTILALAEKASKYRNWVQSLELENQKFHSWQKTMNEPHPCLNVTSVLQNVCTDMKTQLSNLILCQSASDGNFSEVLQSLAGIPHQMSRMELLNLQRSLIQKLESKFRSEAVSDLQLEVSSKVKSSLVGLQALHLESDAKAREMETDRQKWQERCNQTLDLIESGLTEYGELKSELCHYFRLLQLSSVAEAMLATVKSQADALKTDVGNLTTLESIANNFTNVQKQSIAMEKKRLLVETCLSQVGGLRSRVAEFVSLIENQKSEILNSFFGSSSLTSKVESLFNLPMTYLTEFDESALAPVVSIDSVEVASFELSVYRLSNVRHDLDSIRLLLELMYPANPDRVLDVLIQLKKDFFDANTRLAKASKMISNFRDPDPMYSQRKIELLEKFLQQSSDMKSALVVKCDSLRDHNEMVVLCHKIKQEIDDWKYEPVKEVVKKDESLFCAGKSLSKWYQELHANI